MLVEFQVLRATSFLPVVLDKTMPLLLLMILYSDSRHPLAVYLSPPITLHTSALCRTSSVPGIIKH